MDQDRTESEIKAPLRPPFKRLYPLKPKGSGPEARSGHRIVYDDGCIYSYGGYNPLENTSRDMTEFPMFRELWQYNIASQIWSKLETSGDIPKESASYAALLLNHKLLVFGGTGFPFAEVRNNLLYCCDLQALHWSVVPCTGTLPKRVYGHTMLVVGEYIYLFGGTTGFFYNNDMYRLCLSTFVWERICSPGVDDRAPTPRYRHEMATDGRFLYVFGGGTSVTAEPLDQVWAFDTKTISWKKLIPQPDPEHGFPAPRKCHGCVQDKEFVFITGGLGDSNRPAYNDVWRFDLKRLAWTKLPISMRKEVYFHATSMSPSGTMYTFGGVLTRGSETTKRTRALFKVDLLVKPLSEACWERLVDLPQFTSQPHHILLSWGVPDHFLSRIARYEPDMTVMPIASAS